MVGRSSTCAPLATTSPRRGPFLRALSRAGAELYRTVQLRLDLLYPALLAVATGWTLLRVAPAGWSRPLLVAIPLPAMMSDCLENGAIARMLAAGAEELSVELVGRASLWSQLKALFSTLSLGLLVIVLAIALSRRLRRTRRA